MIEPGLLKIFRFYTGMAVVYFALIAVYYAIETGQAITLSQINSYFNVVMNLVLLAYLSWSWLRRKMKSLYLPVALAFATVMPVVGNLIYLKGPEADNITLNITRNWQLLPILAVPLVLISWQYRFRYVVLFIAFITVFEWIALYTVIEWTGFETLQIVGIPLVVAIAFGTIGVIVNRLVRAQKQQRRELIRANLRLAEHAKVLEDLAVSRERVRLARELHDTLAHTLTGLTVNLEAIRILLPDANSEVHQMLRQSLTSTRAGLDETRRAMKDLRAKQLEDLGVRLALQKIAREAAQRAGFRVALNIQDPLPELSPLVEQAVYRIAQEALENIVRHARAGSVRLDLERCGSDLVLQIGDDGQGFDQRQAPGDDHLGLRGIRERARQVGGQVEIDSQGSGTTILFKVEVGHDPGADL